MPVVDDAAAHGQPQHYRRVVAAELPASLRTTLRWVNWAVEERNGKPAKVPYDPHSPKTRRARVNNPDAGAKLALALRVHQRGEHGLGLLLGRGVVGVDLDHCRNRETGEIDASAREVITALGSYTEVSPSGTGIHILVLGVLPPGRRRRGWIEMYDKGRFFTMTGDRVPDTPADLMERGDALQALHQRVFSGDTAETRRRRPTPPAAPPLMDDDLVLIDKAKSAANGVKFSALWNGDTSSYDSPSEADAALCAILAFWTGGDAQRVDRLFRQSGLMREKWDLTRGDSTYGALTVSHAIAHTTDTYAGRNPEPPPTAKKAAKGAQTGSAGHTGARFVGVGELLAQEDEVTNWIVERRIAAGSVNLIAGKPKSGKSTLARVLAFAIARGALFLGHQCRPCRVVYAALEDKKSEVREHLRIMGANEHDRLLFLFDGGADLLGVIEQEVRDGDVLVVDTAQKLLRVKDPNDYAMVVNAFDPLLRLARGRNVTIILLHHTGKGKREGIDGVLGSTAWSGCADNILLLYRDVKYRVLATTQRIGADLEPTVIEFDAATGKMGAAGTRALVEQRRVASVMYRVLEETSGWITQEDLLGAVDGRRALNVEAVKMLRGDPLVEHAGTGRKGDPLPVLRPQGPRVLAGTAERFRFPGSL